MKQTMLNLIMIVAFVGAAANASTNVGADLGVEAQTLSLSEFVDGQQNLYATVRVDAATASNARDAENLAKLAEKLLHTQGFIYVNEVAQQALALDPTNRRAKLYKSVGELIEKTRGLTRRILPLARSINKRTASEIAHSVDGLPLSLAQFMLDGPEDIHTSLELQDLFLSLRSSVQKISKSIGELEADLFYIRYYQVETSYSYYDRWRNEWISGKEYTSGSSTCPVDRIAKNVFVFEPCKVNDWRKGKSRLVGRKKFVDALDIEALKVGVNAFNIYFTLFTSTYSLEGLDNIAKKLTIESKKGILRTPEGYVDLVKSEPKFLTLKDKNIVADMKLKGHEFVDSLKWYQKNFKDLCGSTLGEERDGHLLGPSLCNVTGLNGAIYQIEQALSGPVEHRATRYVNTGNWWDPIYEEHYDTEIDFTAFLDGKMSNLQVLMPDQFDRCGNATRLPDDSMGGLYPRSDYTDFMRFTDPKFMTAKCP